MRAGSVAAAPFLGDQFVSLYLGAERVPTVPGKPVITEAGALIDEPANSGFTLIFTPPASDGGSPITEYLYSVDGEPFTAVPASSFFDDELQAIFTFWQGSSDPVVDYSGFVGRSMRVRAVNAVGQGPLSDVAVAAEA
jgi:hypothetical protein